MIDPFQCLSCHAQLDTATEVTGQDVRPDEGDMSLCIKCGAIAVFTGHGNQLREATVMEMRKFLGDRRVQIARGAILAMRQNATRPN